MLDSALRGLIGLLHNASEAAGRPLLPFSLDELQIVKSCTARMRAWVREAPGAQGAVHRVDVDVCDEQGEVAIRLQGLSCRAVEASEAPEVGVFAPSWVLQEDRDPAAGAARYEEHIVIGCGLSEQAQRLERALAERLPQV